MCALVSSDQMSSDLPIPLLIVGPSVAAMRSVFVFLTELLSL